MKYTLLSIILLTVGTTPLFAADNTELLDAVGSSQSTPTFTYKTFSSCKEFESTMKAILPKTTGNGYYRGIEPMFALADSVSTKMATPAPAPSSVGVAPIAGNPLSAREAYSETNTQVLGIDEADTVKTDGKYLYSYQESEHAIIVLDAKTLEKKKSIRIPSTYYGVSFYLTKNKLVLTATKSSSYNARWFGWYNNEQKSIIALYDITDATKASLLRVIQVDGNLSDSRLADDGMMTVVVSTSFWTPPIYRMYSVADMETKILDYSSRTLIPKISDMVLTSRGAYKTESRSVADCSRMGSILPDASSLEKFSFTPNLTSILRFDTSIPAGPISSQVVLSEAGQIHLTKSSIYLTSNMWLPNDTYMSKCGVNCMMPNWYTPGQNATLVHRFAFDRSNTNYVYSTTLPGNPLNQYSMDEDGNQNFRIVTTEYTDKQSTRLSILSPKGKELGKITDIARGENFQSSRFIGERLYLVTFQQIDPLFVIDLKDPQNPIILGELKIPGYSTYLHPYDKDRLIGIGYDTKTNQWGGTQNGGLKIDLYNVADIKNPKREQTLTLGDVGSSSDALSNPHAFVWYKEKNLLLIPALLMKSANDPADAYLSAGAFQGAIGISITPASITEKFRVSHIVYPETLEKDWKKDCAQYTGTNTKPVCRKLLDGSEYCTASSTYVPNYCYAGSTLETYFATQLWNYSSDFVSRVLYVGENFYTLGTSKIRKWSISDTTKPSAEVRFSSSSTTYPRPIPVDVMVK